MGINYESLLEDTAKYTIDMELLKDIEYNEILFIISKEIVKYREENNLKQQDLAKLLKVSQEMISKMESGKYNHTIKSLVNLWNTLSTDEINFGAKLLKKIYDKVIKNYNTIQMELKKEEFVDSFEFKEEKEIRITYKIDLDMKMKVNDINEIFKVA